MMVRAFIQARMTSSRFPGKVLAPFGGHPVLWHVAERVGKVLPAGRIVLVTSTHAADDPLAAYGATLGLAVVRGSLDDVFARFRMGLAQHRCDWFFRVCADSPLLDPALLSLALARSESGSWDLVTNVHPRTFAPGLSVELVRADAFMRIDEKRLSAPDREHVTRFFYEHATEFAIDNFENPASRDGAERLTVDTLDDIGRLEPMLRGAPAAAAAPRGR